MRVDEDANYRTSVRTCKVRLLILLRPSETIQTTTFFQPSGPQVLERFLLQRWAMFLMTLREDEDDVIKRRAEHTHS